MAKDLRGFLEEYEKANPREFCRITKEVDPRYEAAAILTKLEQGAQTAHFALREGQGIVFSGGHQRLLDQEEDRRQHRG